jgi:hypothetical protein
MRLPLPSPLDTDADRRLLERTLAALPKPVDASTADIARRDRAAIAQIEALNPATTAEKAIAGQYVTHSATALAKLQAAARLKAEGQDARRCETDAATFLFLATSSFKFLMSLQAKRRLLEQSREPR